MASLTIYPTQAEHDGTEQSTLNSPFVGTPASPSPGTVEFSDTILPVGERVAGTYKHVFLKFPLPTMGWLAGKVVTALTISFYATETDAGGTNSFCFMEKTGSPANLAASANNITSRSRTTAFITFSGASPGGWGSWTALQTYSFLGNAISPATPTGYFTDLLNEVVAAVGAANMDALAFMWILTGSPNTGERVPSAFGGAQVPSLTIDYYEVVGEVDEADIVVLDVDSRDVVI